VVVIVETNENKTKQNYPLYEYSECCIYQSINQSKKTLLLPSIAAIFSIIIFLSKHDFLAFLLNKSGH